MGEYSRHLIWRCVSWTCQRRVGAGEARRVGECTSVLVLWWLGLIGDVVVGFTRCGGGGGASISKYFG